MSLQPSKDSLFPRARAAVPRSSRRPLGSLTLQLVKLSYTWFLLASRFVVYAFPVSPLGLGKMPACVHCGKR